MLEFPSDDNCAATAAPKVNIALGAGPGFTSYFQSRSPNGNTPALTYYNSIPINRVGRYDFDLEAIPKAGTALVFQHLLLHEGCKVHAGVKYAMRSDVMDRG